MTQSTFVNHNIKTNIDIFPKKMCSSAKSLSTILTGLEIGYYIVAILFEIIFSHWRHIYVPITIARGLIIPFLIMEIFGNNRQHYGIIISSCVFRALKFILAIVLLSMLYLHSDMFGRSRLE